MSLLQGHELDVYDGGISYSKDECDNLISSINAGNRSHGGAILVLQVIAVDTDTRIQPSWSSRRSIKIIVHFLLSSCCMQADALIGCFRFLEAYYLLFVVKKKYVGTMCGELSVSTDHTFPTKENSPLAQHGNISY